MTEFLTSCGYADYAERFVVLGFDSWQSVELLDRDDILLCFTLSAALRHLLYAIVCMRVLFDSSHRLALFALSHFGMHCSAVIPAFESPEVCLSTPPH